GRGVRPNRVQDPACEARCRQGPGTGGRREWRRTPMSTLQVGEPVSRVDGRAKVPGEARYSAEYNAANLAPGHVASSDIARGTIESIDAGAALALPGVMRVFTYENTRGLPWFDGSYRDELSPTGSPFRPLYDDEIEFSGQPVALVVAETLELA